MVELADMKAKLKNKILYLYGRKTKIYGPYVRKIDGRKIIVLVTVKKHITKLYAKVKLEVKLKRILSYKETVDHIDENSHNDKFSNLQLLSRSENARKSSKKALPIKSSCLECKRVFTLSKDQRKNSKKAGPFCSKVCSGIYGKKVQSGGKRLKRKKIVVRYS